MKSSTLKRARIAAMPFLILFLVLGLAGTSHAAGFQGGVPWQVGDVIVCLGSTGAVGGTCRVLRINGSTVTLLDQFSDGLLGDTHGVAINNTLHAVVTDNGGSSGSNVVVYSIASVNPQTAPAQTVSHTPVNTFTASGGTNSDNAQAVAVDGVGHIFVGNAGSGGTPAPSIVELDPGGGVLGQFTVPTSGPCAATTLASLDVSADGNSVFFTALDGTIRQVSAPISSLSTCSPITINQPGGLSPSITASGISVLPPDSLVGNCSSSVTASVACPNGGFLVVAKGTVLFDFDIDPGPGEPDPGDDTANICTLQSATADPTTSCALLLDSSGNIVTTYPITGVGTLQALSLDPLVTDCTVVNCSTPQKPTTSNFWVGDSLSLNFYEVNFGSGTVSSAFNANPTPPAWQTTFAYALGAEIVNTAGHVQKVTTAGTSGPTEPNWTNTTGATITDGTVKWTDQGVLGTVNSRIQGLRIYGAEGANQADLTKLFTGSLSSPSFTASVNFPPLVPPFISNDVNTWTLTQYPLPGFSLPPPTPITLYASLISQASAVGNNSGATDPLALRVNGTSFTNPVPCDATTTDLSKCIIWKADITVPAGAYLSETINSPNRIDSGTDLFIDLHYDVTTTAGVSDCCLTSGGSKGSVHSLHEVPTTFTNGGTTPSGCVYSSPVANACYKTNRATLNFTFQCSGLPDQQTFANMQFSPGPPDLSLVRIFPTQTNPKPAPKIITLSGTNSKAPYRYSTTGLTGPNYTFQWNLNKAATSGQIDLGQKDNLRGCTFDPTGTVQSFCVDFTTSPTCK